MTIELRVYALVFYVFGMACGAVVGVTLAGYAWWRRGRSVNRGARDVDNGTGRTD